MSVTRIKTRVFKTRSRQKLVTSIKPLKPDFMFDFFEKKSTKFLTLFSTQDSERFQKKDKCFGDESVPGTLIFLAKTDTKSFVLMKKAEELVWAEMGKTTFSHGRGNERPQI